MEHHLDETSPAPSAALTFIKDGKEEQVANFARSLWYAHQQQLQGYLMGSLSGAFLAQVPRLQKPSEVWHAIHAMFAAQSQAQAINTRIELTNLQKGNMTMVTTLERSKVSLMKVLAPPRRSLIRRSCPKSSPDWIWSIIRLFWRSLLGLSLSRSRSCATNF